MYATKKLRLPEEQQFDSSNILVSSEPIENHEMQDK